VKRLVLFLLIPLIFSEIKSQSIEFFKEDITFMLKEDHLYVDGVYHFCNISGDTVITNLYYPFPENEFYGIVDTITISDLRNDQAVEYNDNKGKGVYFRIDIQPYGICRYRISYNQELKGNRAEYILLTTQAWNKAFEIVNYRLIVSDNITVKSISYIPDSMSVIDGNEVYYWEKRDFMPDRNMIFEFD
jgi:hypothetical protein